MTGAGIRIFLVTGPLARITGLPQEFQPWRR
jgi:hypothetical protein